MISMSHIWEMTDVRCCMCKKEACKHKNKNIRKKKKTTGEGGPSRDDLILSDKSTMLWNLKKMAAEDAKHVRACEWVCFRDRRVIENVWEIERERWSNMNLCLIITPKALDRLRRQMPKCECVCQSVNMCVSAFFSSEALSLRHFWHLFPAPCHASVWPPSSYAVTAVLSLAHTQQWTGSRLLHSSLTHQLQWERKANHSCTGRESVALHTEWKSHYCCTQMSQLKISNDCWLISLRYIYL